MPTVTLTAQEIRPSADIMFYNMSPSELEYRMQTFIKTSKILYSKSEVSEDKLTRILTIVFIDPDTYQNYRNDPIITDFRKRKFQYNRLKGISDTFTLVEDPEV